MQTLVLSRYLWYGFPLLKCFIGFPIFWFWIFGFWIFEKTSDCLFVFPLRVRKEQIISYEWLFFKSEQANVNFGKEPLPKNFLVKYFITLKRYLLVLMNYKTVLWSGALFFKYWNLIMVPVVFSGFLVLFSRKKRAVIPLSNDKHTSACYHRENYFDRTHVNI